MQKREIARLIADRAGPGYFTYYWDDAKGKPGYDTSKNTREITDTVLDAHFDSSQPIGINPILPDGTTHFLIFDIDAKSDDIPQGAVNAATEAISRDLQKRGVDHCIVRSGGGRGTHVWCVYETPMTARGMLKARQKVLEACCGANGGDQFKKGSGGCRAKVVDDVYTHEVDIFPKGEKKQYNIALPFSRKSTLLHWEGTKQHPLLKETDEIEFKFATKQKTGTPSRGTGSKTVDHDAAFDAFITKYDVDSYDSWGAAALCLRASFPEDSERYTWAYDRWLEWSRTSSAYSDGDEEKWTNGGEPNYAPTSFWYIARDHGYDGGFPFDKKQERKMNAFAFLDTIKLLRDNTGEPIAQIAPREYVQVMSEAFKNYSFDALLRSKNEIADEAMLRAMSRYAIVQSRKLEKQPVWVRFASAGDKRYLHLADDANTIIEVDRDGWRMADDAPVYFRRGMCQELPMPVKGEINDFASFLNVRKDDLPFVLAWMVTAMYFPEQQCPILLLDGQAGSGKSSALKTIIHTIDPKVGAQSGLPENEGDLIAATYSAGVASFDNLSTLAKMSDKLCRLSTGGGLQKRRLYTDNEVVSYDAMKPLLVVGIDPTFYKQDLTERIVRVTLKKPDEYMEDETFNRRLENERAGWLGAVLDLVSLCIRDVPDVREVTSRFATYVRVGEVIARFLGYEEGWFTRATRHKQEIELADVALSDYVLQYVAWTIANSGSDCGEIKCNSKVWLDRMDKEIFEGTFDAPRRDVPDSPKAMGLRLQSAAPELEKRGIKIERGRRREFIVSWSYDEKAAVEAFLAEVNQTLPF